MQLKGVRVRTLQYLDQRARARTLRFLASTVREKIQIQILHSTVP